MTLVILAAATGCSGASDAPVPQPDVSTSGPSSMRPTTLPSDDQSAPADGDQTPSTAASKAPDPTAPATPTPLGRQDPVKKRVSATKGTFRKAVTWSDGVRLEIVALRQDKTTGKGAGVQPGLPQTTFALELTNDSTKTVDARAVVVTATYADGKANRLATAVYSTATSDFDRRIKAKSNATATYAFSIPKKRLTDVSLTVDLDAKHDLARFTGSAR